MAAAALQSESGASTGAAAGEGGAGAHTSAAGDPAWRWRRWRRRSGAAALALAAIVVASWLCDIIGKGRGGGGVPEPLSRATIVAALAAGSAWLAAAMAARLAGLRGQALAAALVLPALLALALAVRFAGLGSEASGRYYLDEGTYYHQATMIDSGEPLIRTFAYPHLTYYADALALWCAARLPGVVTTVVRQVYGRTEPLAVAWVLLRGVVALLSALTVVPVYLMALRLSGGGGESGAGEAGESGPVDGAGGNGKAGGFGAGSAVGAVHGAASWSGAVAGALAAALVIFSELYNEGSHLNTCDVPSAFFATLCLLFVVRLIDRERSRDYVLAGVAAGLAAASKYPAGFVALGIAAVWGLWRLRRRDWNGGLAWAALAAIGSVIAVMPSLLVYPERAFTGGKDVFFGAHQYAHHGWLGVIHDSNAGFYAAHLLESFGWPAVAAGLSGLALIAVRSRGRDPRLARLLWLAPYPAVFLALIVSMTMVVKHNLYPVLPLLAVYLGIGVAAWIELAAGLASRPAAAAPAPRGRRGGAAGRRAAAAVIAVVVLVGACLWLPADLTARQTIGYVTPSTREEAAAWILAHLPQGAALVKESYTPELPPGRFAVSYERFAGRIPLADLRSPQNDYLLLSSSAYSRFGDPEALFTDNQRLIAGRYDQIFRSFPLLQEWIPDELQLGPVLRLYRIDPDPAACLPSAVLPAADAYVSDDAMAPIPSSRCNTGRPASGACSAAVSPPAVIASSWSAVRCRRRWCR